MRRKCFISFKTEDLAYKRYIQDHLDVDMIDKSVDAAIESDDEDYVMRQIRERHLADSTVTIHLIGAHSGERLGAYEQRFIKRELQGSLSDRAGNARNGVLGVVLPAAESAVYKGSYSCARCGNNHNYVAVGDETTVREFSYNYYIPHDRCSHSEEERYCVLTKWADFAEDPSLYIEAAYAKRASPIAAKVRVYGR